jgi:hypothetical protein
MRLRTRFTYLWYGFIYRLFWIRYGFKEPDLADLVTVSFGARTKRNVLQ